MSQKGVITVSSYPKNDALNIDMSTDSKYETEFMNTKFQFNELSPDLITFGPVIDNGDTFQVFSNWWNATHLYSRFVDFNITDNTFNPTEEYYKYRKILMDLDKPDIISNEVPIFQQIDSKEVDIISARLLYITRYCNKIKEMSSLYIMKNCIYDGHDINLIFPNTPTITITKDSINNCINDINHVFNYSIVLASILYYM